MNKAFRWIPAASAAVAALAMVLGAAAQPVETAPTVQSAQTEDQRLMAFFEEVFQRNLKDSPIFQSQLGIKGPDYGKWGDLSDGEAIRQNELTKQDLARLRAEFRYETLSEPVKISYRIFPLALPQLRLLHPEQPGHRSCCFLAERPSHRRRVGCRGLHIAPQWH